MREIKFRAWYYNGVDVANGEMQYDVLVNSEGLANVWDADIKVWSNCVKVMQYTGLKDSKGVEIYESDRVTDGINPPFVVIWDYPLLARLAEIEIEVIGNVYEP